MFSFFFSMVFENWKLQNHSKIARQMLQDAPKDDQDAIRTLQDVLRSAQDVSRGAQDAQRRPRWRPKCAQDAPREHTSWPKTRHRAFKPGLAIERKALKKVETRPSVANRCFETNWKTFHHIEKIVQKTRVTWFPFFTEEAQKSNRNCIRTVRKRFHTLSESAC